EHRWLNRSVETAQRRVEQQNFSIRKRTLEYDDVMNKQREVIYAFRGGIVRAAPEEVRARILDVINDLLLTQCESLLASPKEARVDELVEWVQMSFPVAVRAEELRPLAGQTEAAAEMLFKRVEEAYLLKCSLEDQQVLPVMERQVVLHAIDTQWQEYLRSMDELRHGVGLRAYGQRDPLVEYKREAFSMFEELMGTIKSEIAQSVFRASTSLDTLQRMMGRALRARQRFVHDEVSVLGGHPGAHPAAPEGVLASAAADFDRAVASMAPAPNKAPAPMRRDIPKVGRNDDCPCGSGKKYKKCCGKNT
ncbi:MAG: SEC-C metal-binding domain-containing protein, partial [Kiritimatiellae bacterium]|nr:SEC-C metal-binding domain-containing protein [Kiritimatiellia bacterium]